MLLSGLRLLCLLLLLIPLVLLVALILISCMHVRQFRLLLTGKL